jgi:hypothetical protein
MLVAQLQVHTLRCGYYPRASCATRQTTASI